MPASGTLEFGPNVVAVAVLIMPFLMLLGNAIVVWRTSQTRNVAEAIHKDTIEVNAAVNHKDHGFPTLVQRVTDQDERGIQLADDLAANREWTVTALQIIADHLKVELPEQPALVISPDVQIPTQK